MFVCFFLLMMTANKRVIMEANRVIVSSWAGNSGIVGVGEVEGVVVVNTMVIWCVANPMDSPLLLNWVVYHT